MACEFPHINANNDEIRTILLQMKNIAVIGMSPDSTKDSYRIGMYLKNTGYTVYPVYPKEEKINDLKVYCTVTDVPSPLDLVVIFRKPDALFTITQEILNRSDVKAVWFQLGLVNNEAAKLAQSQGLTVIQNRCVMVEHRHLT